MKTWQHAANEWADAATNGLQWVRNIRDGISTPEEAIDALQSDIAHARSEQPDHAIDEYYRDRNNSGLAALAR